MYAKKTCNHKLYLITKMLSLKLQEETLCLNHLNTFEKIMNQQSAMSNKFDDEVQGLFPLDFFSDSYYILGLIYVYPSCNISDFRFTLP